MSLKDIDTFCDTRNPTLLDRFSESVKKVFIHYSRIAIYQTDDKVDKALAFLILKHLSPYDCIERGKTSLRPLQMKVSKYFLTHNELLLNWGTGCGKTIAALTASQCFRDQYPNNPIIVISPKSVINNFHREIKKYGWKLSPNYQFYTFDGVMNREKKGNPVDCKDSLLIIDEVHNIRGFKGKKFEAVMKCAMKSKKRLLLSATPFVNNLQDFISVIDLLYGEFIIGPVSPDYGVKPELILRSNPKYKIHKTNREDELDIIGELLKNKVSYAPKCVNKYFPSYKIRKKVVPMSEKYWEAYQKEIDVNTSTLFKEPKRFYHGHRRAVNKLGFEEYFKRKIEASLALIKNKQSLFFSNWIEYGVNVVKEEFEKRGIKYGVITGKTSIKTRNQLVKEYNSGEISTLFITRAGNEGIDLKGTRVIIILDPVWHPAGIEQIIGRGIRFKSHTHLPKKERNVTVWKMLLVEPGITKKKGLDLEIALEKSVSGDAILYRYVKEKELIQKEVNKLMERASI